ncbi:hypothetical protein A2899_01860 [Candidatus Amesbacteria bacterium RIFCSPLOWO2_01_FULL_49_25]|uniref:Type II secretion system protein GspF domain-containing protein n=1 Tax=Candidatus Amesbacteria bacterium RIFCSPHIGHO2_01_FULL_48_32b TaxID=1797253 RepID=A0A1F4YFA1_9BACT|nr:MAG: hypothetical protein A2876_05120 [Candidatus Amesbacteria bacterium RIFCSPHIGHO2_01_FULL_48_32b]OGD08330.1 MAG: hypothetical protein A2899_01860 [Candidatus Amesbacteria bacterium RIFCSPLOWO2_01_FULL_49_25]
MKFKYSARAENGVLIKGEIEAGSDSIAADLLKQKRLIPIGINKRSELLDLSYWSMKVGRVSSQDVTAFTRQLATMITAGLPITDALNLLKIQSGRNMSVVVAGILSDVQGGVSLSESLSKFPRVFSRVYVALIKAGESAGVVETVLMRLADNLEKQREFRGKVVGAMIYPAIVVVGMIVVTVMTVLLVVPKLTSLYADFNADLPIPTKILIAISQFSVSYWWLILFGLFGLVIGVGRYLKTAGGREKYDSLIYKIPVWGTLVREVMLVELTRTLALLVGAGVSVVDALDIVADAVGNVVVEKDVKKISRQVEKGFPVSISFSESQSFPLIVGQMMAVGEETGKMDDVLMRVSHYFEMESEQKVKALTTAIEPLIIMVLAGGVGFLMYAVIMPIYTITNKI